MSKNTTPLEKVEQIALVKWLDNEGLMYCATAQSTWSTSIKQVMHNKAMGVRKGFPDIAVAIPSNRSTTGHPHILYIEMKRRKGGRVGPEQEKWIEFLNEVPGASHATVAYGVNEAIKFISKLLVEQTFTDDFDITEQDWWNNQ